VMCGAFSC